MDVLALGDFILTKEEQPTWPEGRGEGLESEDIMDTEVKLAPKRIADKFGRIFEQHFWPTAEELDRENQLVVNTQSPPCESTWQSVSTQRDRKQDFEYSSAIDSDSPVPTAFAEAICDRWQYQPAAKLLAKTMTEIMKVGLANLSLEESEELPESVYVMF
jgi:hypothetical protein